MKSVKSIADLKQLALAKGATVEVGGTRYNTTNERVQSMPKRADPMPEPVVAKPEPAAAPEVRVDMAPVADAQMKMGEMLARALASQPTPPVPVREWLFTIERDGDGLLTSIRAIAQI